MAGASPVQTQEDLVPPAATPLGYRWTGVLLAPAVAVVVLIILTGPFDLDIQTPSQLGGSNLEDLDLLTALVFTLVTGVAAWILAVVLARAMGPDRGRRVWMLVAFAVLAVSFLPVALLDISTGAKVGLVILHSSVAMVLIPTMAARGQF